MRTVFPVKYYKDEGFVERKIELDDDDLQEIIQDWLIDRGCTPESQKIPSLKLKTVMICMTLNKLQVM